MKTLNNSKNTTISANSKMENIQFMIFIEFDKKKTFNQLFH